MFEIRASNATPSAGTLLLSGTFGLTRLAGTLGGSTASVTSNNVTYTGGAIYNALVSSYTGTVGTVTGELSISLINVAGLTGGVAVGTNGQFAPFTANASGLYSATGNVVPEAGTMLALPGLLALASRRRRA